MVDEFAQCPFPYFGGKRRVAVPVWRAFGPGVSNYAEPFFGSGAVLLNRPGGAGKIETVNDRDRMIANFWRAILADPWAVAEWADGPVNEADMHAWHVWLVQQLAPGSSFVESMHTDPFFYDPMIAGRWCWGICQWIGGGWCVEPQNHKHPKLDGIGKGVHSERGRRQSEELHRKRPVLDGTAAGRGVHSERWQGRERGSDRVTEADRPELAGAGKGVHARGRGVRSRHAPQLRVHPRGGTGNGVHSSIPEQHAAGALRGHPRPNLNGGQGVHAPRAYSPGRMPAIRNGVGSGVHAYSPGRLPAIGNDRGIHGVSAREPGLHPGTFMHALYELALPEAPPCFAWFSALAQRLRTVRVICGDWTRVLGNSVLGKGEGVGGRRPCAVFLDPPYLHELRDPYLYAEDDPKIAISVRDWALEHGDDPDLRIALCGYVDEHDSHMPSNWRRFRWKGARGYAAEDNDNREKETIWFSPHCLGVERQLGLFDAAGAGR